jgi:hypothetical protein
LQTKITYRCINVKFRSKQCDKKTLIVIQTKDKVDVMQNTMDHSCETDEVPAESLAKVTLSQDVIDRIDDLFSVGCRMPKKVQTALREDQENGNLEYVYPPTMNQIKYQLKKISQKYYGKNEISLGQLKEILEVKSALPEDPDEMFVVAHKVVIPPKQTLQISDDEDGSNGEEGPEVPEFWFLCSTKRLLENVKETKTLCADETYKLLWMGFSGVLIGTIDLAKKFHALTFGFSSSENTESFHEMFQVFFFIRPKIHGLILGIFFTGNCRWCQTGCESKSSSGATFSRQRMADSKGILGSFPRKRCTQLLLSHKRQL